jgi:hypothetical protein
MKLQSSYSAKPYLYLAASAAVFFIHVIDEIMSDDERPPYPVFILVFAILAIHPFLPRLARGIISVLAALAFIGSMMINHIVPFLQEGDTKALYTAFVVIGVSALSIYISTRQLILPESAPSATQ